MESVLRGGRTPIPKHEEFAPKLARASTQEDFSEEEEDKLDIPMIPLDSAHWPVSSPK